jgi:hypothetical protein
MAQVAMLPDAVREEVDLALVDGGVNDVDFLSVIDDVDSLTVRTVTASNSDENFVPNVQLVVTVRDANGSTEQLGYQLNLDYRPRVAPTGNPTVPLLYLEKVIPQFEPGAVDRFTLDTEGKLRLDQITGCAIAVGGDPYPHRGSPLSRMGTRGAPRL